MAEDRAARSCGDHVIRDREREGRHIQAYNIVKMIPPMTYQPLTYRSERRALRIGRTNTKTISTNARTTKASTTRGNSAHSSGWLKPAATSTHPGKTTAKFQITKRNHPSLRPKTARFARRGTT